VTRPAFDQMIAEGRLLEWADVHGHRYGTSLAEYETACAGGQDLLLDIDVQGAAQVRAASRTPGRLHPAAVGRGARGAAAGAGAGSGGRDRTRLGNALREIRSYRDYDYVLVNDDLESCVDALQCIIRAARCRTSQVEETVQGSSPRSRTQEQARTHEQSSTSEGSRQQVPVHHGLGPARQAAAERGQARVESRSRKSTRIAMEEVLAEAVSWELRDDVKVPAPPANT
jgi:guanylate kinase